MTWFKFRFLYLLNGEPIVFEKARVLDSFDDGRTVAYLLELLAKGRLYYGIFGARFFRYYPAIQVVEVSEDLSILVSHVAVYSQRRFAERAFENLKSGRIDLFNLKAKRNELQRLEDRINHGGWSEDPLAFMREIIEKAQQIKTKDAEAFVRGVRKYFSILIRMNREKGFKLFVLKLRNGSEVSVFASDPRSAMGLTWTKPQDVENIYIVDDKFNRIPAECVVRR